MRDPVLAYIAGPFSGPDDDAIDANIQRAVDLAVQVAELGLVPVCPHANTADRRFRKMHSYEFWIGATLRMLDVCDIIVMTDDWERSSGARGEHEHADSWGTEIFYSIDELRAWVEKRNGKAAE